ncbi:MAG: zinc ribbon domain-containing protein [Dehalococcoidia bacterium]|nr:zinc ribbon domain-containing protein [Dehalococcoidia bacterium]
MPIYEYICENCKKKVGIFMRPSAIQKDPACPACGGTGLRRIFSSFAVVKSIAQVHEESGNPGPGMSDDYYKDPRNIGRSLETQFKNMNMEIPPEIRSSIDKARDGVLPDSLRDMDSASSDSAYS